MREVGRRLGAIWLIEGSVRRDRNRVRVTAQLVSARDGYHAWSERFDRRLTDIFAIQDEIAHAIAQARKVELTAHARPARPTLDLAAYDLYVKGRSISRVLTAEAYEQARGCYEAAIVRDPRFALAHFALADLLFYAVQFGITASPHMAIRAREALARALELDDRVGEAHGLLGVFRGILDHDWPGSEAAFRRAFELSPGAASLLSNHAWLHLVPRLQLAQALDEAQQAVELDPLSPFMHGRLGLVRVAAREYGLAVEACRRAVELAPGVWWLPWFHATALFARGRRGEVIIACVSNHLNLLQIVLQSDY